MSDGGTHDDHNVLWRLVQALQRVSALSDLAGRNFIVRLISDELEAPLPVAEQSNTVMHLYGIVDACRQRPDGLDALLEVLDRVEPGATTVRLVRDIITEMRAFEVWPKGDREELFTLLQGVVVRDISDVYRFVGGRSAPDLPVQATFREVFLALETLNVDPDGLPKPLVFIEYLAIRVRRELGSELRMWADRQATRFGVVTALQATRRKLVQSPAPEPPQPRSRGYLLLMLRLEGPSGVLYRLSHWAQLDVSKGWHPKPGLDFVGDIDQVKLRVAELAEATSADWARYEPEIRVEFVLTDDLLNLDVDQWDWETESPMPEPVGCRFAVVVRSLERMKNGQWYGSWQARWRELQAQLERDGWIPQESGHHHAACDDQGLRMLTSTFERTPGLVSLILSEPPKSGHNGHGQLVVGLRAGVPLIVWHRHNCRSDDFIAVAKKLLHEDGPDDVLERTRFVRSTAYGVGPDTDHVGNSLSVMWDDPDRIVVPRAPSAPERVVRA